jgi:hypothetical protein
MIVFFLHYVVLVICLFLFSNSVLAGVPSSLHIISLIQVSSYQLNVYFNVSQFNGINSVQYDDSLLTYNLYTISTTTAKVISISNLCWTRTDTNHILIDNNNIRSSNHLAASTPTMCDNLIPNNGVYTYSFALSCSNSFGESQYGFLPATSIQVPSSSLTSTFELVSSDTGNNNSNISSTQYSVVQYVAVVLGLVIFAQAIALAVLYYKFKHLKKHTETTIQLTKIQSHSLQQHHPTGGSANLTDNPLHERT